MMRTKRLVFLLVGVAVLGLVYLTLYRAKAAPGPATSGGGAAPRGSGSAGGERVVPVATATVTKRDVPIIVEGLGTVTPLATVTVKTLVDGRLDKILFKEGEPIKKGDPIAQVDPRPFAIQLSTAEAALARDDAQLKNAKLDLARYEQLREQSLIPQQQLDTQKALVGQLAATAKSDQAQIDNAKLQLDYARITSPVDGVTGVRLVDQGNIVHPGDATGIVIVTQLDPIAVLFTLPQDDLPRVQESLKVGKPTVTAYARDGVEKLGQGELLLVDNQVNAQTSTIRLKAIFPNPDKKLWPLAFVKARLHVATVQGGLVVPAAVVQRGPNGAFAYVVGADATVQPKPVVVAQIQGDLAVLASGLHEGEVVVTDGQNQLKPGGKVAPRTPSSASSGAPASPSPPAPRGAP